MYRENDYYRFLRMEIERYNFSKIDGMFRAVLNKKASGNTTSGAKVTPKPGMTPDDTKVVYPLNLSPSGSIVTAVTDVTGKAVAGVKYYNLAGIESDRPFEGVNIIVTTYTDGSRSSSKVLK